MDRERAAFVRTLILDAMQKHGKMAVATEDPRDMFSEIVAAGVTKAELIAVCNSLLAQQAGRDPDAPSNLRTN
jgi:hypothetical protein